MEDLWSGPHEAASALALLHMEPEAQVKGVPTPDFRPPLRTKFHFVLFFFLPWP